MTNGKNEEPFSFSRVINIRCGCRSQDCVERAMLDVLSKEERGP